MVISTDDHWRLPILEPGQRLRRLFRVLPRVLLGLVLGAVFLKFYKFRIPVAVHGYRDQGFTNTHALAILCCVGVITLVLGIAGASLWGMLIKSRQMVYFPRVRGRVLSAEPVYSQSARARPHWVSRVECAYDFGLAHYEGLIHVTPISWSSGDAVAAYLAERISHGECDLAINPEDPSQAFLLGVDPRIQKRLPLGFLPVVLISACACLVLLMVLQSVLRYMPQG
jgi:hypothetical protein